MYTGPDPALSCAGAIPRLENRKEGFAFGPQWPDTQEIRDGSDGFVPTGRCVRTMKDHRLAIEFILRQKPPVAIRAQGELFHGVHLLYPLVIRSAFLGLQFTSRSMEVCPGMLGQLLAILVCIVSRARGVTGRIGFTGHRHSLLRASAVAVGGCRPMHNNKLKQRLFHSKGAIFTETTAHALTILPI